MIIANVFVIAIGFVIQILAGGLATGTLISISPWIITMTLLFGLLYALVDRRNDLFEHEDDGRMSANNYDVKLLTYIDLSIIIIGGILIVCYIMLSVSSEVIAYFDCKYVYVSSLAVLLGFIRCLQMTCVDKKRVSFNKVMSDKFVQSCLMCYLLFFSFLFLYDS